MRCTIFVRQSARQKVCSIRCSTFGSVKNTSIREACKEFNDVFLRNAKYNAFCFSESGESEKNVVFSACVRGASFDIHYFVKNTTNDFFWSDSLPFSYGFDWYMAIVQLSVFSIKDGEDSIELTTNDNTILGIHLLYETDITMSDDEYDSSSKCLEVLECDNCLSIEMGKR
ncbi:hypothetical protein POM88_019880 [Heracleum sosnowskyi]|uniref:Uncharacterized protein n=1 Tax=Heracleum sosnowskyi TaxID=360622 RepID=A0AAD8IAX9_9APIA|nr:hypothetical protein POM88_019880 [Heracleum sosnowskyi]